MRVAIAVLGLLVALAGAVWMAQGFGLSWAPRSFMTADRAWIVIGAAAVILGVSIVARATRRR